MASKRVLNISCRSARSQNISASVPRIQGVLHPRFYTVTPRQPCVQIRNYTSDPPQSKHYNFEDVKSLTASSSRDRILIDVREPGEYQAGAIPRAINLPIASSPEALSLPRDEFEDRFGVSKPRKDQEVVFYCKAGIRSTAAAQLALQEGYQKVGEYRGSWLDWEKNTKGST